MANDIVCDNNKITVRAALEAIAEGCATTEEIVRKTGACGACAGCLERLPGLLLPVCDCLGTGAADVFEAFRNGADTPEKLFAETGAGAVCGRCKQRMEALFRVLTARGDS